LSHPLRHFENRLHPVVVNPHRLPRRLPRDRIVEIEIAQVFVRFRDGVGLASGLGGRFNPNYSYQRMFQHNSYGLTGCNAIIFKKLNVF
jgi:hypothetical protein